ncbi:sensor histidine kinase [Nocardioides sp.]|uniref:sensor histidine kinase n=1 Tax=Nocardioides sp. TaxID=35761 RepID=UPI0039E6475E
MSVLEATAGTDRFGTLFRQFAVLAQFVYAGAGLVMLAILAGVDGGLPAYLLGLGLVLAATALLVPVLQRGSPLAQTVVGAVAGVPCGLAVVPLPWREVGELTASRPTTALAAAPVLAVTAAAGMVRALPALATAIGSLLVALHLAAIPLNLGVPLGVVITWLNGGVLIALARRGFRLAARAMARAETAEQVYRHQQRAWQAQQRRDRLLHDTLLATLDLLAHTDRAVPATRVREAARRDLEILRGSHPATPLPTDTVQEGYDALLAVAAELTTASLAVEVTLGRDLPAPDPVAWGECLWAVREALRNIARHAGVDRADVAVGAAGGDIVITVVDAGVGFDPDAVPAGRLGLRTSVLERLARVGGSARVWSTPGQGTCVVLRVPAR